MLSKWQLTMLLLTASALLGALLVGMAFQQIVGMASPQTRGDLWMEVGKTGLQVLSVVVLGGIVTAVLKDLETQREEGRRLAEAQRQENLRQEDIRRQEHRRINEYRQSILLELRQAYDDIKRVRRLLAAAGLTTRGVVKPIPSTSTVVAEYEQQMLKLNDAQLALEYVITLLTVLPDGATPTSTIKSEIRKMEQYVRCVITEFQRYNTTIKASNGSFDLSTLKKLITLTGTSTGSDGFGVHVADPFHAAASALAADILGKSSPPRPQS